MSNRTNAANLVMSLALGGEEGRLVCGSSAGRDGVNQLHRVGLIADIVTHCRFDLKAHVSGENEPIKEKFR